MAGVGEGETAAKKASATCVCWVKAPSECLSETSSVFAFLRSQCALQSAGVFAQIIALFHWEKCQAFQLSCFLTFYLRGDFACRGGSSM